MDPLDQELPLRAGLCDLRRFRAGDEEDLAAAANHREVWRNLRDAFPHPYERADAEQWIAIAAAQSPLTDLAITRGERVVGGIGVRLNADVHRFAGEVGYWLAPREWGSGVATAALGAFVPWALTHLGLTRLYADIFAWNPASGRVLEKCGFRREGLRPAGAFKDGRFVDLISYGLVRGPLDDRS